MAKSKTKTVAPKTKTADVEVVEPTKIDRSEWFVLGSTDGKTETVPTEAEIRAGLSSTKWTSFALTSARDWCEGLARLAAHCRKGILAKTAQTGAFMACTDGSWTRADLLSTLDVLGTADRAIATVDSDLRILVRGAGHGYAASSIRGQFRDALKLSKTREQEAKERAKRAAKTRRVLTMTEDLDGAANDELNALKAAALKMVADIERRMAKAAA